MAARQVEVNGARLSYRVAGSGDPVICVQGVGVAGSGWQPQVAALATRYSTITFDNRGIGESTLGSGALSIGLMAQDVLAIMAAEGIERAHLVGHSMGGLIALAVATEHPQRVRSLSLLCTFADGREPTRPSARMVWLGMRSRIGTREMRRNAMLDMVMAPEYLQSTDRRALARRLADLFGHDLADHPPIEMQQLRAMGAFTVVPRLAALANIPTLVVSGAYDPIAPPSSGRRIAAGIPGATFVEFEDASHALTIQCDERINSLLLKHLTLEG